MSDYLIASIKYYLLILLLCCSLLALAQERKIEGHVRDLAGKGIASANVTLNDTAGKILAFKFSDDKGYFTFLLTRNQLEKPLKLKVNAFGYQLKESPLSSNNSYEFRLEENVSQLDELIVKGIQRVKKKGDTTSYSVGAFSGEEDRSIGDVISKIPGMRVDEEGKIKFKDKDIKGLFIGGDNLLGDNYGLGSRAISKEMIKSIEVIERFQPVRALKDKVGTNDVALNLVLKDENAVNVTGQASVGAGLPELGHVDANAMLFNKKVKGLGVAKFNNTGTRYVTRDIEDLLSDAVASNPGIPEKYLNRNRSMLGSANLLFNLPDTLQVKGNVQFAADRNRINYHSLNRNFIEGDTITYTEQQNALRKAYLFSVGLSLEQNKTGRYLNERLTANFGGLNAGSTLSFNDRQLAQKLGGGEQHIENQFSLIPKAKRRNTYGIDWRLAYRNRPQDLLVSPGVENDRLNQGKAYQSTFQDIGKRAFENQVSLNYFINDGKLIRKSFSAGVSNEFQTLHSTLSLTQVDGQSTPYQGDTGNELKWQRHRQYIKTGLFIQKPYLNIFLSLPLTLQQLSYRQESYQLDQSKQRLLFNPNLIMNYHFSAQHSIDLNYDLSNAFGNINQLYRGTILRSFKELRSNSGDIQEIREHKVNLNYVFRNTLQLLDVTTGISYSHRHANSIYSTIYESDILTTVLLPYRANQSTLSLQSAVNKYLHLLKSKFELSGMYTTSHTDQLINGSFLPYENRNWNVRLTMGCNLIEHFSLYYSGAANWFSSIAANRAVSTAKLSVYNHNYSLVITPKLPVNIILQGRQQINTPQNGDRNSYFFADLNLRYQGKKKRMEYELEVNNLLNKDNFGTNYLTTNQFFSSEYLLRGRLILLKANFYF